jgi:O-glycosyl hydrolase
MILRFLLAAVPAAMLATATADTTLKLSPDLRLQEFQGMGCGAIFYEAHITSLAARGKTAEQTALYDAMFRDVRTDFLQLMIRPDHEPQNDNDDPRLPAFDPKWFSYVEHDIAMCKAARERNPAIRFHATLYTPPAWQKTNHSESGGGKDRATLLPNMELELAEYCWAFLARMQRAGFPVEFLSIANEPDWPHDQPGYSLTPAAYGELLAKVARYLDAMARRYPAVPRARIVGPNTLSAVDTATRWLPALDRLAPGAIAIVGCHDYDRRGERFAALRKLAGRRPLWVTEACVNGPDHSPGLLNSAGEYWLFMTEAFNQGVNVWQAYDWVYPPRAGGEALLHVDWGERFHRTRLYDGFRQWCAPLVPGMRVVKAELTGTHASGISQPGVKAAAFLSADGKRLVAHVANVQDRAATLLITPGPGFDRFAKATARRFRTSATEGCASLPDSRPGDLTQPIPLPARSLNTWEWTRP